MGDFKGNFDRRRSRGRFDRGSSGGFGGRDRDRGSSGGFGGRDRRTERHDMHDAVCDKCGKDCQVPFRPTEGKPIYCDDCFKTKSTEAGSRSGFGKPVNNEKFDQINNKLDKILGLLEGKKEKPTKIEKGKPEFKKPKSLEEALLEENMPISFKAEYFWSLKLATILERLRILYFFFLIKSICCWKEAASDCARKLWVEAIPSKGICFFPKPRKVSKIKLSSPIAKI